MGDVNMSGKGFWHGLANVTMDLAASIGETPVGAVLQYTVGVTVIPAINVIKYLSRAGGCSSSAYGTREDRR